LKESGSCLVIVNTKKAARSIYHEAKKKCDKKVYHLSTNMCPVHRRSILSEIRSQLGRTQQSQVLCISTQLIEAGVDIDFGSVIRYIAGLDSIAQAAGRCNRNGLRPSGKVIVVNPADESLSRLPDIEKGKCSSERILSEFERDMIQFQGDILGPLALELYFKYYFYERKNEMDYPIVARDFGRDDTMLNIMSINDKSVSEYTRINNGKSPEYYLRQSFMSAAKAFKTIDAPTQGVVVPFGKEGKEIINDLCSQFMVERQYDLLRNAQQYSVNLFPNIFEQLQKDDAIFEVQKGTGIFYLIDEYYSDEFGLLDERGNSEIPIA